MEDSQLQLPLICWRTKHLMRCVCLSLSSTGIWKSFHLERVCVRAHARKLGPVWLFVTPWTVGLRKQLHYYFTAWKRLWCWEGLGAGEWDNRGWDGWMASLTRWMWAWVNSGSWWWTGRPGVLQFMGSQRVGHDWATELNWTDTARETKILQNLIFIQPLQQLLNPY